MVGRGPWTVVLPGGPLTLLQIAIGIVDLGFCALAMYVLVPDEPNLGFVVVAVIFVSATLLGFASHSPGGLGVFDAAMLVGLWQMDKEDLLAGMLLFRVLYYLAPFVISVILLTFREVILGARSKRLRPGGAAALEAAPAPEAAHAQEARRFRRLRLEREWGDSRPMTVDAPQLLLDLLALAGPVAAFGHHPARRRAWRSPRWWCSASCRGCARSLVFACIAAAALVPWRLHQRRRLAEDDALGVNPVETAGGPRDRRRHARSRRPARPRRPRHPSQCGGGATGARAAQE